MKIFNGVKDENNAENVNGICRAAGGCKTFENFLCVKLGSILMSQRVVKREICRKIQKHSCFTSVLKLKHE